VPADDALRAEYQARLGEFRALEAQLEAALRSVVPAGAYVVSRVKTFDSVRAKLEHTGASTLDALADVVGIRVVVPDAESLRRVVEVLTDDAGLAMIAESAQAAHLTLDEHLATRLSVGAWSGAPRAEIQVLTEVANGLSVLEHWAQYKGVGDVGARLGVAPRSVRDLSKVIDDFERLLGQDDVHEKRDVHRFVDRHQFLLFANPDAFFSEPPIGLGTEYRIDFLIRRPDATYLLVELENPRHAITTANGDFSAAVNHALCQVEDWQEWIEDNLPTVQRRYPDMAAPEGIVVVGRTDSESPHQARRIRRRNINNRGRLTIRTYDDLLADARSYVRSIERSLAR
jgi:ppGpp synthetase/RelA/SpoT-type nucleotidyltranferase